MDQQGPEITITEADALLEWVRVSLDFVINR